MADNYLGQFEEIVLLATLRLGGDGYGVTIRHEVEEATGRSISIGALYTTLDRLERKGFVSSQQGEPTAERGGRAKRYFKIEAPGMKALEAGETARAKLTAGLKVKWA